MRITAFWAKGYRSLVDVRLDDLGPFNVFYGPNGAGKSNILAAMRALFGLLAWRSAPERNFELPSKPTQYQGSTRLLHARDRSVIRPDGPMVLGARVAKTKRDGYPEEHWPADMELVCELSYDWFKQSLAIPVLRWARRSRAPEPLDGPQGLDTEANRHVQLLVHQATTRIYALIDADRVPRAEALTSAENDVAAILAAGKLKEGLFRASAHPKPAVRRRLKQFQALLQGPPLHRGAFELIHDAHSNAVELVESTSGSAQQPSEVPLDLAGLGIAQIYSILGQALLRDPDVVGIEEPEAHLHAPTSGRHLRQLLERLVNEHYLDQLFIATHSNLFDLDATGYYDVSLDEHGATRIERKPLSEIDRQHLYEPGPAKHALADFLSYMDADAVVFRRSDGSPVGAGEMLDMLQRDDEVAVEFLRDVHGAAVRAVRVKSKKPTEPATEP